MKVILITTRKIWTNLTSMLRRAKKVRRRDHLPRKRQPLLSLKPLFRTPMKMTQMTSTISSLMTTLMMRARRWTWKLS